MFIGLNGWPSSGKDTVAATLTAELGYRQYALADKVREAMYLINPLIDPAGGSMRVRDVVDRFGWTRAKRHPRYGAEIRQLMQRVGTDSARTVFGDSVWVDTLSQAIDADLRIAATERPRGVVVSDVRFPNEAKWVNARGGVVVRVDRAGVGPVNDHASEMMLPEHLVGCVLRNDGDLDDLRRTALTLADRLGNRAVGAG